MQAPGQAVIKLSHRHVAIMDFMITNPEASNGETAKMFGVTEPWLSSLIHSELFQMELRYKQDVAFSEVVVSVKDRLNNMAHTSLKRLQERLELDVVSNDTLVDVAELTLKSLGFGIPKSGPAVASGPVFNQQINNNFGAAPIDAKLLADARERMRTGVPHLVDAGIPRAGNDQPTQGLLLDVQRNGDPNYYLDPPISKSESTPHESGARAGEPRTLAPSLAPTGN